MSPDFLTPLNVSMPLRERIITELLEERWFANREEYISFVRSQPPAKVGESNLLDPVHLHWTRERIIRREPLNGSEEVV